MYARYAIYFTPGGALATAGAAWLGWDVATGTSVAHPVVAGLDPAALTETPRKYGFHATLKPPFTLREDATVEALHARLEAFCNTTATVTLDGLAVTRMGRFFALTPVGDVSALNALAADIVTRFDAFRAASDADELARRRRANLSAAQEHNLVRWGYPYVTDQFRFHMTLTGRTGQAAEIAAAIKAHFDPVVPAPFVIDHLTLAGQRKDGMFQQIARVPLKGLTS